MNAKLINIGTNESLCKFLKVLNGDMFGREFSDFRAAINENPNGYSINITKRVGEEIEVTFITPTASNLIWILPHELAHLKNQPAAVVDLELYGKLNEFEMEEIYKEILYI